MPAKRIFVLNGHPAETSLNRKLAETYAIAARKAGHEVRLTHLSALEFDPDYGLPGYSKYKPLEPDLKNVLDDIEWSQHFVVFTPMWWGSLPAKLKGLFDRAFLPGRAFNTRESNWMGLPKPMMTGRTGRVVLTSDTPDWFLRWAYGNAILKQLRNQILGFVGIKPTLFTHLSGASDATPAMVNQWIEKVQGLGTSAA